MKYRVLLFGIVGLTLAACDSEPTDQSEASPSDAPLESTEGNESNNPKEVRDVQFFLDNPDERRAVREECRNDPGTLENTQECINADEANSEARRQSTRERLGG